MEVKTFRFLVTVRTNPMNRTRPQPHEKLLFPASEETSGVHRPHNGYDPEVSNLLVT
jgi:hypothetical protein